MPYGSATGSGSTLAVTGFATGISSSGTLTIQANDASIRGNAIGIDVTGFREVLADSETAQLSEQLEEQYAGRRLDQAHPGLERFMATPLLQFDFCPTLDDRTVPRKDFDHDFQVGRVAHFQQRRPGGDRPAAFLEHAQHAARHR